MQSPEPARAERRRSLAYGLLSVYQENSRILIEKVARLGAHILAKTCRSQCMEVVVHTVSKADDIIVELQSEKSTVHNSIAFCKLNLRFLPSG